ncbi:hypothetical protein LILAB_23690 [Corallococcus macrosporus]|uniref:Outer membrane protein beta-barrel domain-containing protein n=2 Tax=Myxococcaceae TaxID=31 RepID=F8CP55_MYXFH|nr:hypothetical protein LILAB_23690 [Corallococcus macrosporus]
MRTMQPAAHARDAPFEDTPQGIRVAIRDAMLPRLLPALLLVTVPLAARADPSLPNDERWFSVGPLVSIERIADEPMVGLGLEATFNAVDEIGALGLFGQGQWMTDGYARLAGGVQGTLLFTGVELGVYHQTGTKDFLPTTGLQIAPYFTFVYASVGVRFNIPLSSKGGHGPGEPRRVRHGSEVGLVLTGKFPFKVSNHSTYKSSLRWS